MSRYRNSLYRRRWVPTWLKWVLFLGFLGGLYLVSRVMIVWEAPNSDSSTRIQVSVIPGANLEQITTQLADKDLIRDPWVFKLFVRWNQLSTKLQAGEYVIQRNLTMQEITDILQTGKTKEMKITIPEGYTIEQIDDLLARKGLIAPGDFKTCTATCGFSFSEDNLEGYLFPSTYYVPVSSFSSKAFIERLYRTFHQQISDLKAKIQNSERSLDQIVKVASMIEREGFGDNQTEKAMISDVIWKRLDEGIPLGIDATTRYAKNDWKGPLYTADFETNDPYNTRRFRGLPPTAISNPGLNALQAAVSPKSNEYYYYLHDQTGQIHFAVDLDGHNANKRRYLR